MDDDEGVAFLEKTRAWYGSGEGRDLDAVIEYGGWDAPRLHHAACYGWCSAMRWLLDHGANVEATDPSKDTPLHDAAYGVQYDAAVLLLDAGARVDAPDLQSRTALHLAASDGRREMCKLLVSRGASLDARRFDGRDPEAVARRYGPIATADLLAAVRAAGGWAAYARAPRVQLLMLRILWEQGRAVAPPGLLARLFPHETERRASLRSARAALPRDPFCHIVQFWRSDRDSRY